MYLLILSFYVSKKFHRRLLNNRMHKPLIQSLRQRSGHRVTEDIWSSATHYNDSERLQIATIWTVNHLQGREKQKLAQTKAVPKIASIHQKRTTCNYVMSRCTANTRWEARLNEQFKAMYVLKSIPEYTLIFNRKHLMWNRSRQKPSHAEPSKLLDFDYNIYDSGPFYGPRVPCRFWPRIAIATSSYYIILYYISNTSEVNTST